MINSPWDKQEAARKTESETPQDILCMRCGAKPGVMCRTRSGNKAAYWHGRRNDDWNLVTGRDLHGRPR